MVAGGWWLVAGTVPSRYGGARQSEVSSTLLSFKDYPPTPREVLGTSRWLDLQKRDATSSVIYLEQQLIGVQRTTHHLRQSPASELEGP